MDEGIGPSTQGSIVTIVGLVVFVVIFYLLYKFKRVKCVEECGTLIRGVVDVTMDPLGHCAEAVGIQSEVEHVDLEEIRVEMGETQEPSEEGVQTREGVKERR